MNNKELAKQKLKEIIIKFCYLIGVIPVEWIKKKATEYTEYSLTITGKRSAVAQVYLYLIEDWENEQYE